MSVQATINHKRAVIYVRISRDKRMGSLDELGRSR